MTAQDQEGAVTGVSRRDLLKKGAVVGVTAAWTIPLVQVVSMTPAHADSPSAPPGPPTNNPPQPPGSTIPVQPTDATSTASSQGSAPTSSSAIGTGSSKPQQSSAPQAASAAQLPFTGSNPLPALGVGAAAVALGVGAIAASQLVGDKKEQTEGE